MFDRTIWRTQVSKRLDTFARNPQQDLSLSGATSLLGHLAAITLRPFLEAYTEEPIAAVQVLASIADGPGANQIVKRAAHLRYQAARMLSQDLRTSSELRADIERILIATDTIYLVRQRLVGSSATWFDNTMLAELSFFPHTEFQHMRRRLSENSKSFYDIFRELRQRKGNYNHEDLILLFVGLNDSSSGIRAEAARRLGEYASDPPEALVKRLIHMAIYDRDLETRNAAARAMGSLRDRIVSPQIVNEMSEHLSRPDRFVRSSTALLLVELGEMAGTREVVQLLTQLLTDDDHYVREAAARALGRMGTIATTNDVMQALTVALQDTNADVHDAALDALTTLRELRASAQRESVAPIPPSAAGSRDRPPTDTLPELRVSLV